MSRELVNRAALGDQQKAEVEENVGLLRVELEELVVEADRALGVTRRLDGRQVVLAGCSSG